MSLIIYGTSNVDANSFHLPKPLLCHTWARWLWVLLVLSLSRSLAMSEKTAADYFVKSLPGQPDGPLLKMHAGSANQTLLGRIVDLLHFPGTLRLTRNIMAISGFGLTMRGIRRTVKEYDIGESLYSQLTHFRL